MLMLSSQTPLQSPVNLRHLVDELLVRMNSASVLQCAPVQCYALEFLPESSNQQRWASSLIAIKSRDPVHARCILCPNHLVESFSCLWPKVSLSQDVSNSVSSTTTVVHTKSCHCREAILTSLQYPSPYSTFDRFLRKGQMMNPTYNTFLLLIAQVVP